MCSPRLDRFATGVAECEEWVGPFAPGMATGSPLPYRPPVESVDCGTRVVELGTEEMGTLCGVLSSETARALLAAIDEEPQTASDAAERVDTSIQNALYHLRRLREADLVTVVDTWYSSRGTEMKVYDSAQSRLVLATPAAGSADEEIRRIAPSAD